MVRRAYKFGGWFSADSARCSLGRLSHWWRSVWVSVFGEGGFHTSVALASTVLLGCQKLGACTLGQLTSPRSESAFFASFLCRFGQRNDVPPRTVANSDKENSSLKQTTNPESSNPALTPTTTAELTTPTAAPTTKPRPDPHPYRQPQPKPKPECERKNSPECRYTPHSRRLPINLRIARCRYLINRRLIPVVPFTVRPRYPEDTDLLRRVLQRRSGD